MPRRTKFPVFSLIAVNFGIFRDEFAADSLLQRGVTCEPDFFDRRWPAGTIRGPSAHRAQAERSAASIAILNHIADSRLVLLHNCGHGAPLRKTTEGATRVLA